MISIKRSPSRDVHMSELPRDVLLEASVSHILDMLRILAFLREKLDAAAIAHDNDKLTHLDDLHAYLTGSRETTWHNDHVRRNRHHLNALGGVPIDVNLIDVLDYIGDCVASGMARRGSVYAVTIDPQVLIDAFNNTVQLLIDNVKVE